MYWTKNARLTFMSLGPTISIEFFSINTLFSVLSLFTSSFYILLHAKALYNYLILLRIRHASIIINNHGLYDEYITLVIYFFINIIWHNILANIFIFLMTIQYNIIYSFFLLNTVFGYHLFLLLFYIHNSYL